MLVSMDYFTKWVKTEPLANIRDVDAKRLSGETLSHDSGSFEPLSLTTDSNSIAKPSEDIAVN